MFPASRRLTKKDFDAFKKSKKKSFLSNHFNFVLVQKNFSPSRFAIVISSSIVKKAVARNKLRRRVRSVVSDMIEKTKDGFAMVVYAKKGSAELSFVEIKKQIINLFKKSNVLKS